MVQALKVHVPGSDSMVRGQDFNPELVFVGVTKMTRSVKKHIVLYGVSSSSGSLLGPQPGLAKPLYSLQPASRPAGWPAGRPAFFFLLLYGPRPALDPPTYLPPHRKVQKPGKRGHNPVADTRGGG